MILSKATIKSIASKKSRHYHPPCLEVHRGHPQKSRELQEESLVLETLGIMVGGGRGKAPQTRTVVELGGVPVFLEAGDPGGHQLTELGLSDGFSGGNGVRIGNNNIKTIKINIRLDKNSTLAR